MPHPFHREMAQSSYFQKLTPYLQHLSEDQLLALPLDYFRKHTSELDMAFRLFHAQFLSPVAAAASNSSSSSGELLLDQLRRKQDPQEILDDWRRNRSATSSSR